MVAERITYNNVMEKPFMVQCVFQVVQSENITLTVKLHVYKK